MRAVRVAIPCIEDGLVVIVEVPPVNVVHVAVAVVILAVTGYLVLVDPDVALEIGMLYVHAGIYDRDQSAGLPSLYTPGLGGVYVRIHGTTCLPSIVKTIEF